jgi:hypothetical protein
MAKAMRRRDVIRVLQSHECTSVGGKGPHEKWLCPCGQHSANIPRHTTISPGVVRDTIERMECLPEGWLQ